MSSSNSRNVNSVIYYSRINHHYHYYYCYYLIIFFSRFCFRVLNKYMTLLNKILMKFSMKKFLKSLWIVFFLAKHLFNATGKKCHRFTSFRSSASPLLISQVRHDLSAENYWQDHVKKYDTGVRSQQQQQQ